MPLRLNVGLSRKVGEPDFGSRGASVNLELELDSGAIAEPDRLRQQIRHLFGLAKASIDEELHGPQAGNGNGHGREPHGNGNGSGNGHTQAPAGRANGHGGNARSTGRSATVSQARAIRAIAGRQGLDLGQLLSNRFGIHSPEDLTLSDASALIDELKSQQPVNGGHR